MEIKNVYFYFSGSCVICNFVWMSHLCTIQTENRMKFGCIPYRRAKKLRTSQENLNVQGCVTVDTTHEELNTDDKIENIGPLSNPTPFKEVDLFAFTDDNPLDSPFRDRKSERTRKFKIHVV